MDKKLENTFDKTNTSVPFIVHESAMARAERHIKRLWTALIIAIVAIAVTNIAWLIYISQYDFESYEISTENGGNANYIGNDGDIYNGESDRQKKSIEESKIG